MNPATQVLAEHEIRVPCGGAWLYGDLATPPGFQGVVLFVHGSGSSRHSVRNRQTAQKLQQAGQATLLFDLLTAQEEEVDVHTREHRFDIALLTDRLQQATDWVRAQPELRQMPVGYFGASTGSADSRRALGATGRCRGVAWWPAGSGRAGGPGDRDGAHAANRWRRRPRRD